MSEKVWVCDDEPSSRYPLYTRGNVGEVYIEAVSPLSWSTYGPYSFELGYRDALYEMGVFTPDEFIPPGQCEALGCFGGYIYINASVARVIAVRIPGLTPEAIDAAFFGDYPDVPPYRPDPRDENAQCTTRVSAWLESLFVTDPKTLTDQDLPRIDTVAEKRPDFAAMSDTQLLAYFRSLTAEHRELLKRHVLNTYGCNVLTGIIAQTCQVMGVSHLTAKITAAAGDIDSTHQSLELWELSRMASSSPLLAAAFDQGVDGLLERLLAVDDSAAKRFCGKWDAFIDRWGFIGPSVWEFRSPTYRSNPEIALRMLDRLRWAPDTSAPGMRAPTLAADRDAAIDDVAAKLTSNAKIQGQFLAAARSAGKYLAARERSKLHCTLITEEVRAPLRELGQRLMARGVLSSWEHVMLVTAEEADAFVANPLAYRALIVQRAAQLELLKAKEPPFVFQGTRPPLSAYQDRNSGQPQVADAGTQLTGIGVSAGRYTGRARVLTSMASDIAPGEVIVAATTDSSWGPLFLTAGGVVVETGSVISHAAIVSRELGIPAAVSVNGATRRIRDGATITVDGNTGTVLVH
jgi:pyruvate,water dikinase